MDVIKRGRLLSDFIISGKRPRNQIAALSGLTNTYIRNLEKGEIKNVPKERLIALGVALNLDLSELDILLQAFDRAGLMKEDIPVFIENARNTRFSEAVMPVRDLFAYELFHLSLENTPGRQVVVNDRPTGSLMVEGHRTYTDRTILSRHKIFKELNEAIGNARRNIFMKQVCTYPVDHYICKHCLEDYLCKNQDKTELLFRYRHVLSLLELIKTQRKFNLYITQTCFELHFTIKTTSQNDINNKLTFSSRAPHNLIRKERGRLNGFATENPVLCKCFEDELEQVCQSIIPFSNKEQQIKYLHDILGPVAVELGEDMSI